MSDLIKLTIDGTEAPYVHTRDALLVMLPRALRTQESVVLEVTAGGVFSDLLRLASYLSSGHGHG